MIKPTFSGSPQNITRKKICGLFIIEKNKRVANLVEIVSTILHRTQEAVNLRLVIFKDIRYFIIVDKENIEHQFKIMREFYLID